MSMGAARPSAQDSVPQLDPTRTARIRAHWTPLPKVAHTMTNTKCAISA